MDADWIVIGAGVSGARLTHHLYNAGQRVIVLEKSRGLGGRLCHRRSEHGRFLHGLQYVHLRDPKSLEIMEPWLKVPHAHRVGSLGFRTIDGVLLNANHASRFQFFPETSTFCREWTEGATVHRQTRVNRIAFDGEMWTVTTDDQQYRAPHLASSIPFSQLLEIVPATLRETLETEHSIEESPSCSVMFRTHTPRQLPNNWQGLFFEADSNGPVRFLLNQASGDGLHWTAVLDTEWADENWKVENSDVLSAVLTHLSDVFGTTMTATDIEWANIHWWKYAFSRPLTPSPKQIYPDWNLALVGDGFGDSGKGFEAALLSVERIAVNTIEMTQRISHSLD